jgi:hypothetical protein
MHISIETTKSGKTFGVAFRKKETDEKPFFVAKGNKIMQRKDGGEFVSGPSAKLDNGEYLNYSFMSPEFGDYVLKLAKAAAPVQQEKKRGIVEEMESDIPF